MKKKRLQDRDISKQSGPRPLTPRQLQVLRAKAGGGTDWEAYRRLVKEDPSWTTFYLNHRKQEVPYDLSFINFKQHLTNAYGRLQVNNLRDALNKVWDLL